MPSEALEFRRAFSDDPLTQYVHQAEKSLVGIRIYDSNAALAAKSAYRKNMRSGCILTRHSICAAPSALAASLCPIHRVWPVIRDRVAPGDRLFERRNCNSVNRVPKSTMVAIAYDQGGLFSSHAFRRGAADEMKNCASTFATILTTG